MKLRYDYAVLKTKTRAITIGYRMSVQRGRK